jgi:hypothetical protein
MEFTDDPMQEWSSRIEFNRAHHAIGKSTEVAAEMGDEVGAGDNENDATDEPLKRDQTDYPPALRGVTSLRHLETLAGESVLVQWNVLTQTTQPHPPRAESVTCARSHRASCPAAGG